MVAFLGDFSKGVLAVALARLLVGTPGAEALAGLCAVAGHNWSIYIRFRGGRGAVASAGAMSIMAYPIVVLAAVIFATVAAVSKYISLASIFAAISAPAALAPFVYAGLLPREYLAYGIVVAALIVLQHKDNIQRLRMGTERRIGDSAERLSEP